MDEGFDYEKQPHANVASHRDPGGVVTLRIYDMKKLIAYCSRAGNNYVGGKIMNLPLGNTEVAAQMIQQLKGMD